MCITYIIYIIHMQYHNVHCTLHTYINIHAVYGQMYSPNHSKQLTASRDCQTYSGLRSHSNNACRKERRVREREEGKDGGNKGRRSLLLVFYTNGEDNHPGFTTLNQENITVHQHRDELE